MITNMLKKPPAPLPREENDNLDPGHSPDGMQNHNRPLPMTPGMQDDVSDAESDVSDPPEYDKVSSHASTNITILNENTMCLRRNVTVTK